MRKGFDNDKYLAMQSEHIRELSLIHILKNGEYPNMKQIIFDPVLG